MKSTIFSALALALLLPLTACGQSGHTDSQSAAADHTAPSTEDTADTSTSGISGKIHQAMQKAKQEMATKNISVGSVHFGDEHHHDDDSRPKAEITPQGDLLIAGNKVAASPEQHTLLLDYRQQILGIAESGMEIGEQGADLGMQAAKEGIWGKLSGKSDKEIEAAIKPKTENIQAAALKLCKRLPDMLSSQQKLAAAMPEFRPYATMEQKEIDDCAKDMTDKNGKKGFAIFAD